MGGAAPGPHTAGPKSRPRPADEGRAVTVGRIRAACWLAMGVMTFGPLFISFLLLRYRLSPTAVVLVIALAIVAWLGPFVYGMYLSLAVVRNGDKRLLRRGIRGTAVVLSRKRTNERIINGEAVWEAPQVYKYHLAVGLPGRATYHTNVLTCASDHREGSAVTVFVSPRNRHRVAIAPEPGYFPPPKPQIPRTVRRAYYCMLAGAVLTVFSAGLLFAEAGAIRDSMGQGAGNAAITATCLIFTLVVGLWIWMAYATKAGQNWARILSTVFFGIEAALQLYDTVSFFAKSSNGGTLIAGTAGEIVDWLTFAAGLAAVILLWNKAAKPYFKPFQPATPPAEPGISADQWY